MVLKKTETANSFLTWGPEFGGSSPSSLAKNKNLTINILYVIIYIENKEKVIPMKQYMEVQVEEFYNEEEFKIEQAVFEEESRRASNVSSL